MDVSQCNEIINPCDDCLNDGSVFLFDTQVEPITSTQGNGICDWNEVGGCTNQVNGCNYSPEATYDNGSCQLKNENDCIFCERIWNEAEQEFSDGNSAIAYDEPFKIISGEGAYFDAIDGVKIMWDSQIGNPYVDSYVILRNGNEIASGSNTIDYTNILLDENNKQYIIDNTSLQNCETYT